MLRESSPPPAAMTENYVVFVEQPIKMDLFKIVTGKLRRKSISDGFLWDPKCNTIFHVIHKKTGEVRTSRWAGPNDGVVGFTLGCCSR